MPEWLNGRGAIIASVIVASLVLLWSLFLTLLHVWAGQFWWSVVFAVVAYLAFRLVVEGADELEHWNDYDEDEACYCIHPIYPVSGHRPHINPRNYDA